MQKQIYVNENVYKKDYYKNNEMNLLDGILYLFVDYLLEFLMLEYDFLLNIQNLHEHMLSLLMTKCKTTF